MIFVKFTEKAICLIYSLFLFNIICLGPAYCMDRYPEDKPSLRRTLQNCISFVERKKEVWKAKRNSEAIQFIEEDGEVVQFSNFIIPEELEEGKKTAVENQGAENSPAIPPSLAVTVEAIMKEEDGAITKEEDGFVVILFNKRINIALSNATSEDEKRIRTFVKSGSSYDSLHLTFKEQEVYTLAAHRMCSAAASAICPDIKEFIFEGPFINKALLMIWNHCPNIETLSLASQNLPEILEELCTVNAEKLKKLTHVFLMGESSPELLTKLRRSFLGIISVKVKENTMVEKDLSCLSNDTP